MTAQLAELYIKFNLREPKSKTPTRIYMIVRCWPGNIRLVYSTKKKIHPGDWDKEEAMPKKGKDAELFSTLNNLRAIANSLYDQFVRQFQRVPSVDEFREMLTRETVPQGGLYVLWETVCNEKKNPLTISGYHQSRNIFMSRWPSLKYAEVTKGFMEKAAAKLEKDYKRNTVGKHLNRLREVMGRANDENLTSNTSYRGFSYESEKIKAVALSEHELELIRTFDMPSDHLDNARDLFLVGCWTGLRFSDYSRLTGEHIVTLHGKKRIKIQTLKTGMTVIIPILPPLQLVLEKRDGEFPRSLSNQKLNKYVKDAIQLIPQFQMDFRVERSTGSKTDISFSPKWELIGTHVGRRSFCTNAYNAEIPVVDIMAISGHSTEAMFFKYIQKEPEESANALEAGWNPQMNNESTMKIAK